MEKKKKEEKTDFKAETSTANHILRTIHRPSMIALLPPSSNPPILQSSSHTLSFIISLGFCNFHISISFVFNLSISASYFEPHFDRNLTSGESVLRPLSREPLETLLLLSPSISKYRPPISPHPHHICNFYYRFLLATDKDPIYNRIVEIVHSQIRRSCEAIL